VKVLKVSEIIKRLKRDGWYMYRHNGTSHRQFKHPAKKGKVTVNGKPSADISGSLLKSIEKQSGLTF
jgi:predicted RNA binding protein YcfA (HicA-like mRNA interferase family)